MNESFWQSKKVFITGHTGFKGSWLCLWLSTMGATVTGYALEPQTVPNLYELCGIDSLINSVIGDIRDKARLSEALSAAEPDVVIHMAAQALVKPSYADPAHTFDVNVMGTVNLLEAVRLAVESGIPIKAVINVTTDKCYENKEWAWGYRENDPLGGYDAYSNSKACSELVTAAYRSSFFNAKSFRKHGVALATARAGNVIGGGDWAQDRLVPDTVRAFMNASEVMIRNPHAIRPWQHVLEPLSGYLLLAQKLVEEGIAFAESWNFGPLDQDAKPVGWIVEQLCKKWGDGAAYSIDFSSYAHEAHYLKLDCSKAQQLLGWKPRWNLNQALDKVIEWTLAYQKKEKMRQVCLSQLNEYSMTTG
ncbi:CDP-glucose 4,6-dehydratase [Paenibacillus luteus]|uniref:CDP-glucose 4,6-dehydratase n=1 Tax=Paenibacillus luteus TaxID=2545753 RepID=UPI001142D77F|nr:CDP-glucose 4,6-dehydratase [Paenibacillus luteus]